MPFAQYTIGEDPFYNPPSKIGPKDGVVIGDRLVDGRLADRRVCMAVSKRPIGSRSLRDVHGRMER